MRPRQGDTGASMCRIPVAGCARETRPRVAALLGVRAPRRPVEWASLVFAGSAWAARRRASGGLLLTGLHSREARVGIRVGPTGSLVPR